MEKLFCVIMWNAVQYQPLERSFCIGLYFSGANISDTKSPGRLNFVWWCKILMFMALQNRIFFMSPYWHV